MKIAFLGCGSWGYCLASLLAANGHSIKSWSRDKLLVQRLQAGEDHPSLAGFYPAVGMDFTADLGEVVEGVDLIVEALTAAGVRPVLRQLRAWGKLSELRCPFVITSKGIEQGSGLILPEVVAEVLGEQARCWIALLSGPGFASEVIAGLPTSVVASGWSLDAIQLTCRAFATSSFRIYPNSDLLGVAFGGALKNIIAIACGMADGLNLGHGAKAALMTRGLHEMRKLAIAYGCRSETLYGLAGLGDMALTCSTLLSRNTRFGSLVAQGLAPSAALEKIALVVEGAYCCISARELAQAVQISMPITETVYNILYEGLPVASAVALLMQRAIKEEHL